MKEPTLNPNSNVGHEDTKARFGGGSQDSKSPVGSGFSRTTATVMICLAALLLIRLWPHPSLRQQIAPSTGVWSVEGELLRITRTSDDQYRLWTPLSDISPTLVEAFLLKEDRWFFWNPGVNPISLTRAALRTYSGGTRQGGSTVTMQLARLLYRTNTRTVSGKIRQAFAALWLEARYSKRELLETYLNVVPFGGNIQGVGAATRIYFGKTPDRVSLGEALTLAVIPQHPRLRAPGWQSSDADSVRPELLIQMKSAVKADTTGAALLAARARLGREWLKRHGDTPDDRRQLTLPIVARPQFALPFEAPHFVDALLANAEPRRDRIDTTIDAGLQRLVERHVRRYMQQFGDQGIHNAALLLVDTRDMTVKASVGSADYWNDAIDGQVNGVTAKRSPGSTLKPFVYALALDQGVLHPRTVLRDVPTSFGPFTPENFDGRFFGPITAEDALIRSRNVPAVWVSTQLRQPSLYQFLQSAGVRAMRPEAFYGLALPLGGGEVTMEELVALYAMLANGGVLRPLRVELRCPTCSTRAASEGVRLISPEASFITLEMLRRNPRPDEDGTVPVRTRWPIAWKTGTSWGFRDAWSVGVVGPYVLAVWIGNFEGQSNPAFVGVDAAAPLFFRVADALNIARPDEAVPESTPPAGVRRVTVCAESGDLPNRDCPRTAETWYIPGKSPIRVSQLHRAVGIDPQTGRPDCPPYAPGTRFETFEFWSSDMLKLFRQAGMPRRTPPVLPGCLAGDTMDGPRIASPLRSVSYALHRSTTQEVIALDASSAADVRNLFWFDGNALIGVRRVDEGATPWRPTEPGVHLIRVVDDHGRSAERDVEVEFTR